MRKLRRATTHRRGRVRYTVERLENTSVDGALEGIGTGKDPVRAVLRQILDPYPLQSSRGVDVEEARTPSVSSGLDMLESSTDRRASNYFRTAEFFRRENYDKDELAQLLYTSSETYFEKAMALSPYAYEAVTIPYENTTLPGYFVAVDKTDKPRKTIIFNGGYDSTSSEGWFAIGAPALARGYNFLAFDGPGQGGAIRKQKLHFRPDWEHVLTPVVDYALTRADVDTSRIAVFGWSMGGYLVARAGTREHRAAALILDDVADQPRGQTQFRRPTRQA